VRLYLSSFRFGDQPDTLVRLARAGRRAVVIMNALDNFLDARAEWLGIQVDRLAALGFAPEELDLRDFFGRPDALGERLARTDLVWACGGNAFILRRAMKQSGFDGAIRQRLADDAVVYAGFSAGAVVAAPSLRGLESIDDPHDAPPGYDATVRWDGLGLLPYAVIVHYRSDHSDAAGAEAQVARYEAEGVPFRALRDGQALVVDGDVETIVG
jgi:dipeptidase E